MNATRADWQSRVFALAKPVLSAAATGSLRQQMPVEGCVRKSGTGTQGSSELSQAMDRRGFSYLEAFARTFLGLAPWLNLWESDDANTRLRELLCAGLESLADPHSPDHPHVEDGGQVLVEAAFLSAGLLRSWDGVWSKLSAKTQSGLIDFLTATRTIPPAFNNWLLFSGMVEALLCRAGEPWDKMRVDYAVRQHEQWYVGDGTYGDGPHFQWDYYNSFVIHPLLFEILHADPEITRRFPDHSRAAGMRLSRHAEVLERLIAPDGTFPPLGRSITYRSGAFHALAFAAWKNLLPDSMEPAGVRCALTAVIGRVFDPPGTFDSAGWLRPGLSGYQPGLCEHYISTGSLYLSLVVFLPLGLGAEQPFWADPDAAWTQQKLWGGLDENPDTAMRPDPRF